MAVTANFYGLGLTSLFNGEVDYDTHTIKVMLCTSTYSPNLDTHQYKSSVTNEVTGTGYTAGGATLASKSVSYNSTGNVLTLSADTVSWPSSVITARYAVVYRDTGTAGTSPLLVLVDFGVDVTSASGPFEIDWDAAGIITATAA